MLVSFPMYILPETSQAQAEWWSAVAQILAGQGIEVPVRISRPGMDLFGHWRDPNLLFSQTCGYPLVSRLAGDVKLVGTPAYTSPGCLGARYCSYIVVNKNQKRQRLEEFSDACFAYNEPVSQSGFNAVRQLLLEHNLPIPFFASNLNSGSHRNSTICVATERADICAVDCVTYSLLEHYQPRVVENTRIFGKTRLTPGLPFISSLETPDEIVEQLFFAINTVCHDPSLQYLNQALLIRGLEKIDVDSYQQEISFTKPDLTGL